MRSAQGGDRERERQWQASFHPRLKVSQLKCGVAKNSREWLQTAVDHAGGAGPSCSLVRGWGAKNQHHHRGHILGNASRRQNRAQKLNAEERRRQGGGTCAIAATTVEGDKPHREGDSFFRRLDSARPFSSSSSSVLDRGAPFVVVNSTGRKNSQTRKEGARKRQRGALLE